MPTQHNSWSCSIYAFRWVIQSTGLNRGLSYDDALAVVGYPHCVNATYGAMSAGCLMDAFATFGVNTSQTWVTFEHAYAIMEASTGLINPTGMYHYMAIRGVKDGRLWVANSAPGYLGVWDTLTRVQFNALGPTHLIHLV